MAKKKKGLEKMPSEQSEDMPTYVVMPRKLRSKVKELLDQKLIENDSDAKWAQDALDNPKENTESTIIWLKKLTERQGVKFVHEI